MAITDENIKNTLQLYANPLSIQRTALGQLQESVLNGKEVSDGNNVFTFLLEFMATMTAGAAGEAVNTFSGLYPSKAMTASDLYKHMSDFDYINLFSTPATTKITLMFDRNYLINHSVQDTSNKTYHKIVIPSQATFTIGTMIFGIYYPIQILIKKNILPDGQVDYSSTTFTVIWDTSIYTPLYSLKTNILEHRFTTYNGTTLFCIDIPVHQFKITTFNESISPSAGFIKRYPYADKFYAIRVFDNINGTWTEMHQTLSDTIYDTTIPTAKIKVLSDINMVEVAIPQVYINKGLIGNKIMTKLYTSLGEVNVDISTYNIDQFSASFMMPDELTDSTYSDMLKYINMVRIVPTVSAITGGKNGMSFTELRNRVIHDSTYDVIITPRDLAAYFSDHDYAVSKYIDNITNRIYFVHKPLVDGKKNIIGAGDYNTIFNEAMVHPLYNIDTDETYISNYSNIKPIDDNSVMILPTSLYLFDTTKNSMVMLNDDDIDRLNKLDKVSKVNEMNTSIYSYCPFHIKLITNPTPHATSYDLMKPTMSNMTFIGENPNIATQASVYTYSISHLDYGKGGYKIYINLYRTDDINSIPITTIYNGSSITNMIVVLKAVNQSGSGCYVLGKYVGDGENNGLPIIEFDMKTSYKLTDSDSLHITNFKPILGNSDVYIKLDATYHVMTFIKSSLLSNSLSAMKGVDTRMFPVEVQDDYTWLSTQAIDISLGKRIDMLYNSVSTTLGDAPIELQPTTTFATYPKTIYARYTEYDVEEGEEHKIGMLKYPLEVAHAAGDLILSTLDDKVQPPTCVLSKTHDAFTIKITLSGDNINLIDGIYKLDDSSSVGVDRVWKQVTLGSTHCEIRYSYKPAAQSQWSIVRYVGSTGTEIYRTRTTTAISTPPMTGWYKLSGTSLLATSTKVQIYDANTEAVYNLSLDTPHTATSWRDNLWKKTEGELYLYGCDVPSINGTYSLTVSTATGTSRVWTRTYTLYNTTTTYRILYKSGTPNRWVLQQEVNSVITELFNFVIVQAGIDPWLGPWVHISDASIKEPTFQLINFDNTTYSVKVEDVLSSIASNLSSYVFDNITAVRKQIRYDETSELYSIYDPVNSWYMFLTEHDASPSSTTGIAYTSGGDEVGTGLGALYIRDVVQQAFDPTKYLSLAQLYVFFDMYDSPEYSVTILDTLATTFSIPKYVVQNIIDWRTPWSNVLRASSASAITSYLTARTSAGVSLSDMLGYQTKLIAGVKTYTNQDALTAANAELSTGQIVWVEDISSGDTPITGDPIIASDYTVGALCSLVKSGSVITPTIICHAPSLDYAKALMLSFGTMSGMMYSIYEGPDETKTRRYISFLTKNENGIDLNIATSSWQLVDKWPWDATDWIDVTNDTYCVDSSVKLELDTVATGAIVKTLSGDPIIQNGSVTEDSTKRSLIYNTSMLHVDYKPTLSSEIQYIGYKDKISDLMRQHFNTLDTARASLLEQTNIYFKPIRTIGVGEFKHTSESNVVMRLDMTMDLRLHVEPRVMVNSHQRDMIESNIYSIVAKHLTQGSLSQTNISRDILNELGDSVIYVDILGINGMNDLQTLIPVDNTFSPYIKQDLYIKEDGTVGVKSGINIKWVVVN